MAFPIDQDTVLPMRPRLTEKLWRAAATEERDRVGLSYDGIGIVSAGHPIEEPARRGLTRTSSALSGRIIDRGLSIAPTIRVKASANVSVIVTRELSF